MPGLNDRVWSAAAMVCLLNCVPRRLAVDSRKRPFGTLPGRC